MFCRVALVLLAVISMPVAAGQFAIQNWQTDEGLPQNFITSLIQSSDGYLWLGTYNGLVRFDGVHFEVFDGVNSPGLKNSRVTSLWEGPDHALWIGHETGDVTRFAGGRFKAMEKPVGWPDDSVVAISPDDEGNVWVLNARGFLRELNSGTMLNPLPALEPSSAATPSFSRERGGRLWVVFRGNAAVLEHRRLVPFSFYPADMTAYTERICPSRDGGLWVVWSKKVCKWKDGVLETNLAAYPWGTTFVTAMIETRARALVVGTLQSGLYVIKPDGAVTHLDRSDGLSHDWVHDLAEDREGNLWVGTSGGGLCVLRTARVNMFNPPDQWHFRAVLSVTKGKHDDIWAGTEGGGLYHFANGKWEHFTDESGLANRFIWSVLEDRTGKLWVGTWGDGLFVRDGEKFIPFQKKLPANVQVTALFEDAKGSLWAGTGVGLFNIRGDDVAQYGRDEGVRVADIRAIAEDSRGGLWFGTLGGGLGCLRDGKISFLTRADGLASDFVLSLWVDHDDTVWVGTLDNGLCRVKNNRCTVVNSRNGLPNNVIGHIADDGAGLLWLTSQKGIFRVSKSELNDCADGKKKTIECLVYDTTQGLATLACSAGFQPSGCRTSDGRFWFPTAKGIASLDPKEVERNILPPAVWIESVVLDGVNTMLKRTTALDTEGALQKLEVPPGKRRLSFSFAGLSYVSPGKVRFKYQLSPLEENWVDAGTRRSVEYSYVPPGKYEFRVTACNNDGVWSERGDRLRIEIQPHLYETAWFKIASVVAGIVFVGGLVLAVTRRRHKLKMETLRRQTALDRERMRIARDIHDELGASLTQIIMLSQSALDEVNDPAQATKDLKEICGTSRELTRAMDEIVWAVNPKHDTLESLVHYLTRYAHEFLAPAHVRCRLELPPTVPAHTISAELRHNLFLAFKEALHNVVKHAHATEVRLSAAFTYDRLVIVLEDDGRGLDWAAVQRAEPAAPIGLRISSGNGLLNMRQRLELLGGRFEIEPAPGHGTRITFSAPLPPRSDISSQPETPPVG